MSRRGCALLGVLVVRVSSLAERFVDTPRGREVDGLDVAVVETGYEDVTEGGIGRDDDAVEIGSRCDDEQRAGVGRVVLVDEVSANAGKGLFDCESGHGEDDRRKGRVYRQFTVVVVAIEHRLHDERRQKRPSSKLKMNKSF